MFSDFFFIRGREITIFPWSLVVFFFLNFLLLNLPLFFEQWVILLHMTCFITIKTFKLTLFKNFLNFLESIAISSSSLSELSVSEDALKASFFFFERDCCSSFFLFSSYTSYAIRLPIRFSNDNVERSFASSIAVVFFSQSGVSAKDLANFFDLCVFLSKGC